MIFLDILPRYYGPDISSLIVYSLMIFIITIMISIFMPWNIGFVIFSVVRKLTKNLSLRKISFIFQICLLFLTFVIPLCLLLMFFDKNYYLQNNFLIIYLIPLLFGTLLVCLVQLFIIIWQSHSLK